MVFLLLFLLWGPPRALATEEAPLVAVYAVRGQTAQLPCDLRTESEDPVILVLWYKNGTKTPVFSMDSRGGQHPQGDPSGSTRAADVFKGRASLQKRRWNWTLLVREVKSSDEGEYRCRLDFQASPTHNARVLLHVVDLPGQPQIYSTGGVAVGDVAVVQTGHPLTLACRATGGDPLPNVTWWSGSQLLDSEAEDLTLWDAPPAPDTPTTATTANTTSAATTAAVTSVTNTLHLAAVTRELLLHNLTCRAANTPVLPPLTASVRLKQTDSLLKVQLSAPSRELSSGRRYQVKCQASGVRPPPILTWWLSGQQLTKDIHMERKGVDSTLSLLQLQATASDDEALLECRARAPTLPHLSEAASIRLTVHFVPETSLTLLGVDEEEDVGVGVEERRELRAGDSATLICTAHANPPPYNVTFMFNGRPLTRTDVVQSEWNLTLFNLGHKDVGLYTCVASNLEGDGQSNALALHIDYPPVCEWEGVQEVLAMVGEMVEMECRVRASPTQVTYTWERITTTTTVDQMDDIVRSPLRHKDAGMRSYSWIEIDTNSSSSGGGGLAQRVECHASNDMGDADQPCVFNVYLVEPPSTLIGCFYHDVTTDSAVVTCSPGPRSSGQLPETYHVEVREGPALVAVYNSSEPRFNITSLAPGRDYVLGVYTSHARARGYPTTLLMRTHTPKAEQVAPEGVSVSLKKQGEGGSAPPTEFPRARGKTPVSMVVAGVVVGLVVGFAVVVAGVVSCRARRTHALSRGKTGHHQQSSAPSSQDSLLRPPSGALYHSCISSPSCELLTTFSPGPVVVTQVTSRGSSRRTSIRSSPGSASPRGPRPALRGGPVHLLELEVDDVTIPRVEVHSSASSRLSKLSLGCDNSTLSGLSKLSPGCEASTLTDSTSASCRCEPKRTQSGSQTTILEAEPQLVPQVEPKLHSIPHTQLLPRFHSAPQAHPRPQSVPIIHLSPADFHSNLTDSDLAIQATPHVTSASLGHIDIPLTHPTPKSQSATMPYGTTSSTLASPGHISSPPEQDLSKHDPQARPTSHIHYLPHIKPHRDKPQGNRTLPAQTSGLPETSSDPTFSAISRSSSHDSISIKLFTTFRLSGIYFP
ncbi:uncharacterized protein [Panulirus ornatus]|uniref:uncharacterized protein n=1 Tax=Panulirus ornatus TaxID=150431 RepID=UPI003A8B90DF